MIHERLRLGFIERAISEAERLSKYINKGLEPDTNYDEFFEKSLKLTNYIRLELERAKLNHEETKKCNS